MKTKTSLFTSLFAFFTAVIYLSLPVSADVGEAPMPGGTITPGERIDSVRMVEESVLFDIKSPGVCPFEIYEDCWYADVTASFTMENFTKSDVTKNLFYPFPSMYEVWGSMSHPESDHSKDFVVEINGNRVDYSIELFKYEYEPEYSGGQPVNLPSLVFPATFRADDQTTIVVKYKTRMVNQPKSIFGSFIYIMDTGSHWSGTIGRGEMIFRFPVDIDRHVFSRLDSKFEILGRDLVWKFEDLKPTKKDNVTVTFSPDLVNMWENKMPYIESITDGGYDEFKDAWFITEAMIPAGYTYSPSTRISGVSPLFTQDPNLPDSKEYYHNWGWAVSIAGKAKPYILFELDAIYKLDGIEVLSGIPIVVWTDGDLVEEATFDTIINRPKTLRLTFSDGSSKTLVLEDRPDVLQDLAFDEVETYSVKVEFVDSYSDVNKTDSVLGLSRLYLGVGDKVGEKILDDEGVEDTEGDVITTNWVSDNRELIIAGICLFVITGGGVTIFVIRKRFRVKPLNEQEQIRNN